MPNLPTFSVTDAQAAKLLQVFGSADAYRAWLRQTLRDEVRRRKAEELLTDWEQRLLAETLAEADAVVPET